jgi:TolB-like protein
MQVTVRTPYSRYRQQQVAVRTLKPTMLLQELCHLMLLALMLLLLGGCQQRFVSSNTASQNSASANFMPPNPADPNQLQVGHQVPIPAAGSFRTAVLASQIDNYYRGANPGPIGVTTFANLDDLYATSSFGRVVSEQLMSELSMRGYDVVELRHTDALQFLQPTGEFALSRDVSTIRRERDLGALIVGTYMVSPVKVYVNARLLNPATSVVLSAGSIELPRTAEVARLLRGSSLPAALERIPVRHLGQNTYPMYPSSLGRLWDLEESEGGVRRSIEPRIPAPQSGKPAASRPAAPPAPAVESKPIVPPVTPAEEFR